MNVTAVGKTQAPQTKTEGLAERNADFAKALKALDEHIEQVKTDRKRGQAKAEEAEREKRIKDKKIAELEALIARLRAKISLSGGEDGDAAAELASAETQLFWLTFGF